MRLWRGIQGNWRAFLRMAEIQLQWTLKGGRPAPFVAEDTVVSLTTLPGRLRHLDRVLKSILLGDQVPARILIYAGAATCEQIRARHPKLFDRHNRRGRIELRAVEDLGPHTKLVYALQECEEPNIITADDDVLYPPYWLSELRESAASASDPARTVVCHRAHRITREEDGRVLPYQRWKKGVLSPALEDPELFPTGTGGVLYPRAAMPALSWDSQRFRQHCSHADDVWFWFCARHAGLVPRTSNRGLHPRHFHTIPQSQADGLHAINVANQKNDLQFAACEQLFATLDPHSPAAEEQPRMNANRRE